MDMVTVLCLNNMKIQDIGCEYNLGLRAANISVPWNPVKMHRCTCCVSVVKYFLPLIAAG